jgi:hypothetical protein
MQEVANLPAHGLGKQLETGGRKYRSGSITIMMTFACAMLTGPSSGCGMAIPVSADCDETDDLGKS